MPIAPCDCPSMKSRTILVPRVPIPARFPKRSGTVLVDEKPSCASESTGDRIEEPTSSLSKDVVPPLLVEIEDFGCAEPHRETDGDNAAGGCAGDKVEVATDRVGKVALNSCQACRRKRPEDAAAVN